MLFSLNIAIFLVDAQNTPNNTLHLQTSRNPLKGEDKYLQISGLYHLMDTTRRISHNGISKLNSHDRGVVTLKSH